MISEQRVSWEDTKLPADWHRYHFNTHQERLDFLATLPLETLHYPRWKAAIRFCNYGSEVGFDHPLTPTMVAWLIDSLQRVQQRMESMSDQPGSIHEFAFREGGKKAIVGTRDGVPLDDRNEP